MNRLDTYPPKSLFILFFKVGGIQVLVFVMWVVTFAFFSEVALVSARQFAEEGEDTSAQVTGKYSERKRSANGNRKLRYYLDLEYVTKAGDAISLNRSVQHPVYDRVEVGDVIGITYLRSNPRKTEVTKGRQLRMGRFVRMLAWLSVLAVLAGTWIYGRRALDAVRARKNHQRAEVKLIEVRKCGWWVFSKGYRLIWHDSTGREGKSLPQKADKLMGFRSGDTLIVFLGGKRSWWVGDVGDRECA